MRGTRLLVFGLSFSLGACLLGGLGVWFDWPHMVQRMIGCMILGLVPMLVGAVLMILDSKRWAADRFDAMTDEEIDALIDEMGAGDE